MTVLMRFSLYCRLADDFFTKTLSGGVITIVSTIVMLLLFFSELSE